jgi:hypothetical protein
MSKGTDGTTLDQLIQDLLDSIFVFLTGIFAWLSELFDSLRPGGNE